MTYPKLAQIASLLAAIACSYAPLLMAEEKPIIALDAEAGLSDELLQAYQTKSSSYEPRTEHFLADGKPTYINRLILEESPYLLQHAHNPVNWYPWGKEAFATAKKENKPIFLSIGYATCHWCHVMERESFENTAIAAIMNEHFIAIKVDREQLPDVDALYMDAVMMINGNGGWPMSSFLDTEGRTFFGGTYFAPGQFTVLLQRVDTLWDENHDDLLAQASQIEEALKNANIISESAEAIGKEHIQSATNAALQRFDDLQGGFGGAPKFPQESILHFLLGEAGRANHEDALHAADFSLQRMAAGGIHDQVGGGFHRYAVDNDWLVPHFEKMLYNQGHLARNYTDAYLLTDNTDHRRTAQRLLDYVLQEMRSEEGLFYSATDADSDGAEGLFFTWTPDELLELLGEKDASLAAELWGVTEDGHLEGRSILHESESLDELARSSTRKVSTLASERDRLAEILHSDRKSRIPPLRDEKIITAWNGMMITALAEAGRKLDEPRYHDAAVKAAAQLWKTSRKAPGELWRTQFEGKPSIDARQQDYAYFAEALIAIYDITGDRQWIERSEELTLAMIEYFWDTDAGGFFMAHEAVDATRLVVRPKDLYDSSMPTGNSVAMHVLAQLQTRTGKTIYAEYADKLIAFFAGSLTRQAGGHYYLLTGISDYLGGEIDSQAYGARGVVKATATKDDAGRITVKIDIAPGWHINSAKPYQDYLIPTELKTETGNLGKVNYPEPIERQLGFERSVLSLYEGSIVLNAEAPAENKPHQIQTRLQACSDEVCLPPETLTLNLSGQ